MSDTPCARAAAWTPTPQSACLPWPPLDCRSLKRNPQLLSWRSGHTGDLWCLKRLFFSFSSKCSCSVGENPTSGVLYSWGSQLGGKEQAPKKKKRRRICKERHAYLSLAFHFRGDLIWPRLNNMPWGWQKKKKNRLWHFSGVSFHRKGLFRELRVFWSLDAGLLSELCLKLFKKRTKVCHTHSMQHSRKAADILCCHNTMWWLSIFQLQSKSLLVFLHTNRAASSFIRLLFTVYLRAGNPANVFSLPPKGYRVWT